MKRFAMLAYGCFAYAFFFVTFLYAIGFTANVVTPTSIDHGAAAPLAIAIVVNLVLLSIFALQHSIMARPAFKRAWTRIVPKPVERSTYVLFASAALALLLWQWRPIATPVWTVTETPYVVLIWTIFAAGWGTVLVATFLINHFELFGLTQAWNAFTGREPKPQAFATPLLYKHVRHPIYLGFIIAFWATPNMTAGHLMFAAVTTAYIFVGIFFEERDLIAQFGERYRQYRRDVGMLIPKFGARRDKRREA